jgi:dCMP deaminase
MPVIDPPFTTINGMPPMKQYPDANASPPSMPSLPLNGNSPPVNKCPHCGDPKKMGSACGCYVCICGKTRWGCMTYEPQPPIQLWKSFDTGYVDAGQVAKRMVEKQEKQLKWDKRFLHLAEFWAKECSKDPSTKTGAVIVDKDKSIVSMGYNGFPKGVDDSEERLNNREVKYQMIVHCERNAILFARRNLEGCTLYTWPFASCAICAGMVIQTGIKRVVYPKLTDPGLIERWGKSLELTYQMYDEAGLERVEVEMEKQ